MVGGYVSFRNALEHRRHDLTAIGQHRPCRQDGKVVEGLCEAASAAGPCSEPSQKKCFVEIRYEHCKLQPSFLAASGLEPHKSPNNTHPTISLGNKKEA